MSFARRVEGLVLCRAAGQRLAVLAREVGEVAEGGSDVPYAGWGFSSLVAPPQGARRLAAAGAAMLVDAAEVHGEPLPFYPVPAVLGALMGGALAGFVEAEGALWPVVSLVAYARFLEVA